KLSDFGMEQVAGIGRVEFARRTGTRVWLAPELFDDSAAGSTSRDVYSLTALLLMGLLGRLPTEVRAGQTDLTMLIPDNVSERLRDLISRGLARNPHHRLSADELRADLDRCARELTGERSPIDTGPVSPLEPLPAAPASGTPIAMWV